MAALLLTCLFAQADISEAALVEKMLHPAPAHIEQAIQNLSATEFALRDQAQSLSLVLRLATIPALNVPIDAYLPRHPHVSFHTRA